MTCFNSKEKAQNCVQRLVEGNPEYKFSFVIVDYNGIDGTLEMREEMKILNMQLAPFPSTNRL